MILKTAKSAGQINGESAALVGRPVVPVVAAGVSKGRFWFTLARDSPPGVEAQNDLHFSPGQTHLGGDLGGAAALTKEPQDLRFLV